MPPLLNRTLQSADSEFGHFGGRSWTDGRANAIITQKGPHRFSPGRRASNGTADLGRTIPPCGSAEKRPPGSSHVDHDSDDCLASCRGVAFPDLRGPQIERLVGLRIERQALLEGSDPPSLRVVFDEAALHRLKGRRELLREQLQRLVDAADLPNVTLQILPFSAGPGGGLVESFRILSFPDPADPDIIHLEHQTGDLYLSSAEQVSRYWRLFERSRALASTPQRSVAFLTELHRDA